MRGARGTTRLGSSLASEVGADVTTAALRRLGYRAPIDALDDTRGQIVRQTPTRTTWRTELPGGSSVFRKLRSGRLKDARNEWRWLARLAGEGFRVPEAILMAAAGERSAVVMGAVPGRALSEWILAAEDPGGALDAYLVGAVADLVRRLHLAGCCHRDLYWNHLFATATTAGSPPPSLIDVERMIRPLRWRRRRWIVKDLGALLGSWPRPQTRRVLALRFLRAWYGGTLPRGWKSLGRAVIRRGKRIRSHLPKYGPPPLWRRDENVRSP